MSCLEYFYNQHFLWSCTPYHENFTVLRIQRSVIFTLFDLHCIGSSANHKMGCIKIEVKKSRQVSSQTLFCLFMFYTMPLNVSPCLNFKQNFTFIFSILVYSQLSLFENIF